MSQPPPVPPQYSYPPPMPPAAGGYVPQYGFWPYYESTPDALLAPARRAGWCLIGVGVAALLLGTCAGAIFAAFTDAQVGEFLDQARRQQPANAAVASVTPHQIRLVMIAFGVVVGGWGLISVILGLLSRTGRLGWSIVAVVFSGLTLAYLAFSTIISATSGANPAAGLVGGICVFGLPEAALVMAIIFLAKAIRNAPLLAAARAQGRQPQGYAPPYYPPQVGYDPPQRPPG